jgi:transcriptional regulator with AAA-type ATPase domain/NAD-dependent dihydropyrimidine dehydrogenase PreA subunit
MKKIGDYLLENNICDESSLESALKEQSELKEKGIFKPLGTVLKDSLTISLHDLDKILSKMHIDILSMSALFQDISKKSIEKTISQAEYKVLPENTAIFNQGEEADSFFVIVSGKVRIFRVSPEGEENNIGHLTSGEGFGEVSLLTGEPHSASATTVEATSLLVLSKNDFNELCKLHSDVSMAFIKGFASRLIKKDAEILKASEKEQAYQQFVSQQDELSLPELIGQTRSINRLRKKIAETAENDQPVLVQGETGTEKLVVAGTIHKSSPNPSTPFLSMDAEDVTIEGYGAIPDADSGSLQLEMAQSSVLFGYEEGAFSFSKARGLGLLQICRQGTVVIENVDKLTKGVQEKLYNYLNTGTFNTVSGQRSISSEARIIATTSVDLKSLAEEEKFNPQLLELLNSNSMKIPPIRKRKSDLRLLVDFIIIMECFKTPDRKIINGMSPEAYQRIMEYDWPGNMDELQIVIRRAINLAHTDYLLPEDIFIGMAPPEGKYTINLLQFENIKKIFTSRLYPIGLQIITASVFSLIFILAFLGNRSPDHNVSVLLVWAMWWPMLTVSWLIGARIWCSVCPMGAVNDLLNRVGKKKFKVPSFVRSYAIYISAAGLVIIIWAEAASKMAYSPLATGFLLLSIASFAILSGIFFERRLWCRYLCPLGRLAAIFSGCSVVEWRSNSSICNSTCKDNSCYKGDEKTAGCPLYQGPFSLRSNQNCILCGNCVKVCPNNSPSFNLRVPGHELWATIKPEKVTIVFVPVIIGTQIFRGIEHSSFVHTLESNLHSTWGLYGLLLIASIAASYGYLQVSGAVAFKNLRNNLIKKGDLYTHAIIPLAFAFEFVYQLNPLLTRLGDFFPTLGREFGFDLEFFNFSSGPGAAKPWQVLFILLGICFSMGFLRILKKNHQVEAVNDDQYKRLRYLPIFLLGMLYIWMFIMV